MCLSRRCVLTACKARTLRAGSVPGRVQIYYQVVGCDDGHSVPDNVQRACEFDGAVGQCRYIVSHTQRSNCAAHRAVNVA
jgi:hypothetical protein